MAQGRNGRAPVTFSIVIPTRERAGYLQHSIQTALAIDDPDIEIVVHDNASRDGTAEIVAAIDDPRLVYARTDARVSMRENFNRAFHASRGDYLVFFGDDDGILPGQFTFLRRIVEERQPDGVSWPRTTFGWPMPGFGRKTGGIRLYRGTAFGAVTEYDGSQGRHHLLGCRLAAMMPIPEIYHGCLSRDFMLRSATSPELVFDSAIPDYCLAYRAVLKGGRFVHATHPFSINGYSPASTGGGQNAAQSGGGDASTSQLFQQENRADPLSDVIGYAGSVPLAFFSTLETVRARHGLDAHRPDYLAWYRYVLSSARRSPNLRAQLVTILRDHAQATGTLDEFARADAGPPPPKRSPGERVARVVAQLRSIRVSAAAGGENTIATAARAADKLLGYDYGRVLSHEMTRSAAWRALRRRGAGLDRQF